MPRKLFPYGKFLGLETVTSPFNKSDRYWAWTEGMWTDFRGQMHKGPGQTITPSAGILPDLRNGTPNDPSPRVHVGASSEQFFQGAGFYQHMWNVTHVGADNYLRVYFGGIGRTGSEASIALGTDQEPDNKLQCLVIQDKDANSLGSFIAWGDPSTSTISFGIHYPIMEFGDCKNMEGNANPDDLSHVSYEWTGVLINTSGGSAGETTQLGSVAPALSPTSGSIVVTLEGGSSSTFNYTSTDTLTTIAAAINADGTMQGGNVRAYTSTSYSNSARLNIVDDTTYQNLNVTDSGPLIASITDGSIFANEVRDARMLEFGGFDPTTTDASPYTFLFSDTNFQPVSFTQFRQKVFVFHEGAKTVEYRNSDDDRHRFNYAGDAAASDVVTISGNTVTKNGHGLSDGTPISLAFQNPLHYRPYKLDSSQTPANTTPLFTGVSGEIKKPNHGLTAGQQVSFHSSNYGADSVSDLPTGFAENTKYFVVSSGMTTDTFKVSATAGGAVLTTSGYATVHELPTMRIYENLPSGVHRRKTYYVINSATNTFQISETVGGSAVTASGDGYGTITLKYWSEHNSFPNGGFGVTVQNRLVVAGILKKKTELHISGLDKEYDWRTNTSGGNTALATDGAIIDVKNQFSGPDEIKGLGVLEGDKLVVFGENETLVYITDTDINKWTIATDFRVGIGLLGRNTIANVGQDLFFCSRHGIHSIRRAVSGLTLETQTHSKEITETWLKLVDQLPNGPLGSTDTKSYQGLGSVFPEPHAWWDNDMGHYTVALPTTDATKWAQVIFVYEKGAGRGEFRSFTYTPSDSPKNKMATCGSYFQTQGAYSRDFYYFGIARQIVGTVNRYVASGVAGDFSGHFFDCRTPVLWQGQPDTYKYYKRLILRCGILYDGDRLADDLTGLFPEFATSNMTLRIRVYDDLNILRHTVEVLPDKLISSDSTADGTFTQFTPREIRPRTNTAGNTDDNPVGKYKDQKNPIEIPLAIRAKGLSFRFDNDTTSASSGSSTPSYQMACGFLLQDFGLIVDTK